MTNNNLCKEVYGMFDDCKTCQHDSNELCAKFEVNIELNESDFNMLENIVLVLDNRECYMSKSNLKMIIRKLKRVD